MYGFKSRDRVGLGLGKAYTCRHMVRVKDRERVEAELT